MRHGCTDETEENSKVEVHLNIVTLTQHSLVTTVFSSSVQGHSSAPRETEPCERPVSTTLMRSVDLLPHLRMCSSCSSSHLGGTMPPPFVSRHVSATRAQQKTEAAEGVTQNELPRGTKAAQIYSKTHTSLLVLATYGQHGHGIPERLPTQRLLTKS